MKPNSNTIITTKRHSNGSFDIVVTSLSNYVSSSVVDHFSFAGRWASCVVDEAVDVVAWLRGWRGFSWRDAWGRWRRSRGHVSTWDRGGDWRATWHGDDTGDAVPERPAQWHLCYASRRGDTKPSALLPQWRGRLSILIALETFLAEWRTRTHLFQTTRFQNWIRYTFLQRLHQGIYPLCDHVWFHRTCMHTTGSECVSAASRI